MTKNQILKKVQFPSSDKSRRGAVVWELGFGIYLVPGPWTLGVCHSSLLTDCLSRI
jgi:hypothetical protein